MDRTTWIKTIHVAKRKTGMTDDAYHALLEGTAGIGSCSELRTVAQFNAVMRGFEACGFAGPRHRVTHDLQMAKAYALWCELHKAGAVKDGSYRALLAFGRRMFRQDILRSSQKSRLIESLKKWLDRLGEGGEAGAQ